MVIEKVEIIKLNIQLKEPIAISLGTTTIAENLVIKLHTDSGLYGIGEASSLKHIVGETQASQFEIAKYLAGSLKGKNPLAIEQRLIELDRSLPGNPTLKSAFDMALYDLLGKEANMPLYQLLGGDGSREIVTDMTIYLGSPEQMAEQSLAYKNIGFPIIKVKLGESLGLDVERIRQIREAIGYEVPLRIDANQGWDPVTAVKILTALEKYQIEYCEEPIPHWNNRELVNVRNQSPIPIMADESVYDHRDALRLASMGACDYFNIKLAKTGGIHNALKVIAIAEAAGIKCQVGGMSESRYAMTALAHIASAKEIITFYDIDSPLAHAEDPVIGGIVLEGMGKWKLPDGPGIGADFDEEFLEGMERIVI
ncbi:MAG: mandelate racemase/muconate lactonizing enzyme family protein [Bacteroidota bacterium]